MEDPILLQVASTSIPKTVAGAIVHQIREHGYCEARAIGAAAINQAVKSIAIANGYLAPTGAQLSCVPYFCTVDIDGNEKTAIKFKIETQE
jgi:stage V sporulation protein S